MELGFHPLQATDLGLLASWLSRPHVEQWWKEPSDRGAVEARYLPLVDGSDPTEGFIVVVDRQPIGFVQRYRIDDDPEWRESIRCALGESSDVGIGVDYLIGEADLIGRGVGQQVISTFVEASWARYPDADRVVVAVQQNNAASWKSLEASGFQRAWKGHLISADPSDQGASYVYVLVRPHP